MATNRTQAERGKFLNADTWDKLTSNIEKGFNEFRGNSDNKLIQILAKYQESKLGQAHTKAGKATADILFKNPYEFGQQMTNDVADIFGMNNPNYQMRNAPGTGWGNVGKQAGRVLSTGSFIAGTGNPLGAAVYTGISGGAGYLGNRIAGQSHKSAMSNVLPNMLESVPRGFQIAGISSLTNPLIDKAGLAGKGYWGRNLIKSPLNVVQGLAMDQATGMKTTAQSMAVDALFPFAQEAAGAAVKNAKEAIEYRNTLSPLERQRGFIKPGEFLPKNSDDLLEEARKYKSAEEFKREIRSENVYYRGTGSKNAEIGDNPVFVTKDGNMAITYSESYPNLDLAEKELQAFTLKDGKTLDLTNIEDAKKYLGMENNTEFTRGDVYGRWETVIKKAKNEGYDYIKHSGESKFKTGTAEEVVVLNPKKSLTPLTDIWNQANKVESIKLFHKSQTQGDFNKSDAGVFAKPIKDINVVGGKNWVEFEINPKNLYESTNQQTLLKQLGYSNRDIEAMMMKDGYKSMDRAIAEELKGKGYDAVKYTKPDVGVGEEYAILDDSIIKNVKPSPANKVGGDYKYHGTRADRDIPKIFRGQKSGDISKLTKNEIAGSLGNAPQVSSNINKAKQYGEAFQLLPKENANIRVFENDYEARIEIQDEMAKKYGDTYRYNTDTNQIIDRWAKENKIDAIVSRNGEGAIFNESAFDIKPVTPNKEIVRDVNMDKAQEWLNRPNKTSTKELPRWYTELEEAKTLSRTPDDYVYHTTSLGKINSIAKSGLKPGTGMYGKGVYFAPTENLTKNFGLDDGAMIRIKRGNLPKGYDELPEQGWVNEVVPPKYLEYKEKGSDVWKPLIKEGQGETGKYFTNVKKSSMSYPYKDYRKYSSEELTDLIKKYDNVYYDTTAKVIRKKGTGEPILGRLPQKQIDSLISQGFIKIGKK